MRMLLVAYKRLISMRSISTSYYTRGREEKRRKPAERAANERHIYNTFVYISHLISLTLFSFQKLRCCRAPFPSNNSGRKTRVVFSAASESGGRCWRAGAGRNHYYPACPTGNIKAHKSRRTSTCTIIEIISNNKEQGASRGERNNMEKEGQHRATVESSAGNIADDTQEIRRIRRMKE